MDQELFNPQSSSVTSSRIMYTPSTFARTSLLHLQEIGSLQAIHPHTSTRTNLTSFLCFVVLSGNGTLTYEGTTYELSAGDCVFIDCRKAYSHSTGYNAGSNNTNVNNTSGNNINTPACEKDTTASQSTNLPTSLWSSNGAISTPRSCQPSMKSTRSVAAALCSTPTIPLLLPLSLLTSTRWLPLLIT